MRAWLQRHFYSKSWQADLAAAFSGIILPLALSPLSIWPCSLIAPTILYICLQNATRARCFFRSFLFGLGMYGVGASWVFRSIFDFGFANLGLAIILTALFVCGLALVFAFPFYLYARFLSKNHRSPWLQLTAFCAVWVLGEWSRSWFLTGFPWLYVGYAHIDTGRAGWAPIGGVFLLSFLSVFSGLIALQIFKLIMQNSLQLTRIKLAKCGFVIIAIWVLGFIFNTISWTKVSEDQGLRVALVQPNIPQPYKWQPYYFPYIMQTMRDLSSDAWSQVDLMLWPENAVPLFYHEADQFLGEMTLRANANNTALITGILYDDEKPRTWFNSVIGVGAAEGTYFKQRLVPFGEYVPMEDLLRGTLRFFDLPHSLIAAGPKGQAPLKIGEHEIAASICYEVVYPDLVAAYAKSASLLITISNDAWFGDSIGPLQHFQMSQMRALENQKYLLRATNTGVSGIVSDRGQVLARLPQFEQGTLIGEVNLKVGRTPFSLWKSWPIVLICAALLFIDLLISRKAKQQENDNTEYQP